MIQERHVLLLEKDSKAEEIAQAMNENEKNRGERLNTLKQDGSCCVSSADRPLPVIAVAACSLPNRSTDPRCRSTGGNKDGCKSPINEPPAQQLPTVDLTIVGCVGLLLNFRKADE